MLIVIGINSAVLEIDKTIQEFQQMIALAAPSPWIKVTEKSLGEIQLNVNTLSYYYEQQAIHPE